MTIKGTLKNLIDKLPDNINVQYKETLKRSVPFLEINRDYRIVFFRRSKTFTIYFLYGTLHAYLNEA